MVGSYLEDLRVKHLKDELKDHGVENRLKDDEVDLAQLEAEAGDETVYGLPLGRSWYPTTYTVTVGITTVLMLIAFPGYFRAPFSISYLSIVIGVVGIFVWVGLAWVDAHTLNAGSWFSGTREAFNPFEELKDDPKWMWQFLGIRFFGLVIVIPFIEEFFLRGFLMRYCEDPDWDEIPLGVASTWVWFVPIVYGAIAHPAESTLSHRLVRNGYLAL